MATKQGQSPGCSRLRGAFKVRTRAASNISGKPSRQARPTTASHRCTLATPQLVAQVPNHLSQLTTQLRHEYTHSPELTHSAAAQWLPRVHPISQVSSLRSCVMSTPIHLSQLTLQLHNGYHEGTQSPESAHSAAAQWLPQVHLITLQ
eukprot:1161997-Pelagomonas_calceolata.AAC.11